MTVQEEFIAQVIDHVPRRAPHRDRIAMDLRSHIAERLERGQTLDEALRQFGDPAALAESYLTAVPLVIASLWARLAAKLIDTATCLALIGAGIWAAWTLGPPWLMFVPLFAVVIFCLYTVVAENQLGQTWGKYLLELQVVRESGARIGLGQAIVRQLPALFQVTFVDALFVFFTEKQQRAFELLSKTRVVRVSDEET